MTRREELAQVRERATSTTHAWPKEVTESDRRFLLGLVDELAAALREAVGAWDSGNDPDPNNWNRLDRRINVALAAARTLLSDLGPDA